MKNNFKVDVLGTYPPPIGGTSIHVERLHRLNKLNCIDCVAYDTYPGNHNKQYFDSSVKPIGNYKKFLLSYFFDRRADIVHSHSHSWVERMLLTMKAKLCGQKIIFTFHSLRDERDKFSRLRNFAYKYTVKHADLFIATGSVVKEKLLNWGVDDKKISLIMPFIAPSQNDGTSLPDNVKDFINKFDIVLTANGSNNDHYNGEDLYGLDMCIELTESLSAKYNLGFVFVLTKTTDKKYLDRIKDRINVYGIADRFLLYEGCVDFIALLKCTTIFVRPTNTDSWPISMSESLSLSVPCVCSDVCRREDAAFLFESRKQEDLNSVTESIILNLDEEKSKLKNIVIADNYSFIYEEYKKLINK